MRLTEREMRRRVRAALLEANSRYPGWEGYSPRWTVPIPPQIMSALVRICNGVSEHIKQNYPPRPVSGAVKWFEDLLQAAKDDPVIERGLLGVITLFRSLLPAAVRTHVSTEEPSSEMTEARYLFMHTLEPHPAVRLHPDEAVRNLLTCLAIIWSSHTKRMGLVSEGSEPLSTKPWPDCTHRGTGPLPPAINAALIKVCTSAATHVEQNYPPRPTGFGVGSDVQAAWSDETITAMKGDPVIERAVATVLTLYKTMIPAEERSLINFYDNSAYLGTLARYEVRKFFAHPWLPFKEFPDNQICVLVGTLTLLCKRFLEREGYTL